MHSRVKPVPDALGRINKPDWCLPSQIDRHPTARLIAVNGLMMDARQVPCEVQVEAFDRGFIPYLPEDNDL